VRRKVERRTRAPYKAGERKTKLRRELSTGSKGGEQLNRNRHQKEDGRRDHAALHRDLGAAIAGHQKKSGETELSVVRW